MVSVPKLLPPGLAPGRLGLPKGIGNPQRLGKQSVGPRGLKVHTLEKSAFTLFSVSLHLGALETIFPLIKFSR